MKYVFARGYGIDKKVMVEVRPEPECRDQYQDSQNAFDCRSEHHQRHLWGCLAQQPEKNVGHQSGRQNRRGDLNPKAKGFTDEAIAKVEKALNIDNLYKDVNGGLVNHLGQALRAQSLYHKDVEYVVKDGEVLIVDEFTGRVLDGRRYSEGLHQAIEAKEHVSIREENQTLATITLQNYFRLYEVLAGMTGTAKTEEDEFQQIYALHVVQIPTNVPMVRGDKEDYVFKTKQEKYQAVVHDIGERYQKGQPVLVGTVSVEVSELLSRLLERQGLPHNVLNAKEHAREAEIVKDAGQQRAVP